ncbi:UDP-3-O-(3-hydroxymyristoyl)glucosamine N-acyltransferase [Pelagovum pacificum]|uniref:UDP-3-O-acylglucosamine N-acyltransferase n=1 Tax=Pelagovum pacificum TaxID=2588711 RepID=A0A5C5GDE5_9RHOB|nr:UDP-3-O-(3-hydroxymyristoyl)glucosamine N-acyltransferase [Pelagovum pacificum]QQA41165.1 UDP-3-O-(3-hydroxymyristoyl)glucosamine N-acyltransferase [Pelagovum pacificum]TNY32027.1 UDP-3-O-(3-hydroxymyristoyl)glucosamine N-acyltransferase [Pelagovum pacificum]
MTHSIEDIAAALGAEALGAVSLRVSGAAEPQSAGPHDLALAMSPAYGDAIGQGQARAAVVWPGADWQALGLEAAIVAPRARLAMARLTQMLDRPYGREAGIHPTAVIGEGAEIDPTAHVGPLSIIGAGAKIGAGTVLTGQSTVGEGAEIGADGLIHAGVRIGRDVRIGARVILQPNVVIGGDGFSFVSEAVSNAERARDSLGDEPLAAPQDARWHRIHSLGGVEIGDDVEVGANSAIDAGTIRATRIGRGTKIDNLVQVGHNVIVGEDCLLCGTTGIAGSTVIGNRVVLGGMTGVVDNIRIGDDVVTGAGTLVISNVPAGRIMMGSPAVKMSTHIESYKALRRLPRLLKRLGKG